MDKNKAKIHFEATGNDVEKIEIEGTTIDVVAGIMVIIENFAQLSGKKLSVIMDLLKEVAEQHELSHAKKDADYKAFNPEKLIKELQELVKERRREKEAQDEK